MNKLIIRTSGTALFLFGILLAMFISILPYLILEI